MRGQLWLAAVAAVSWLTPASAGAFADSVQPKAGGTCSPNGTALSITAFDNKFDKDCLAAPANQAFTIDFNNLDRSIPHNVAIYEDQTTRKLFFKGELIDGPSRTTYSVRGLSGGRFFFRCDPHPEMNGNFVVGNPPPRRSGGSSSDGQANRRSRTTTREMDEPSRSRHFPA